MMAYGYYTGMGALMNGLMAPYGYSLEQTGSIATAFILSGIAGSFTFSILLGRTQRYLLIFRSILVGTLIGVMTVRVSIEQRDFAILWYNALFTGFFTLPLIPIGYSFCVELTHPVSEPISNGIMMLFAQLVGILITYAGTYLSTAVSPTYTMYLFQI